MFRTISVKIMHGGHIFASANDDPIPDITAKGR